jgi:hypothetical protein
MHVAYMLYLKDKCALELCRFVYRFILILATAWTLNHAWSEVFEQNLAYGVDPSRNTFREGSTNKRRKACPAYVIYPFYVFGKLTSIYSDFWSSEACVNFHLALIKMFHGGLCAIQMCSLLGNVPSNESDINFVNSKETVRKELDDLSFNG